VPSARAQTMDQTTAIVHRMISATAMKQTRHVFGLGQHIYRKVNPVSGGTRFFFLTIPCLTEVPSSFVGM
jgi:hypothetical protein